MTNQEREELAEVSHQLLDTLTGKERKLFRRYDFLVARLALSTYETGVREGVERALRITAEDRMNNII